MTLIFERSSDEPQTHAVVIGVGFFPYLDGSNNDLMEELRLVGSVTSPPNNARAIAEWLIKEADQLVPPLGSVELLISATDGSVAQFPRGLHSPTGRNNQDVEPATGNNVEQALGAWLQHCECNEGNLAFFFGSSHGMLAQEHILLLEDAGENANDPWRNMLSLNHIQRNLYKKSHKRSIIFADCCRNLLEESSRSLDPISGRRIGNISDKDYVKAKAQADRFVHMLRAAPEGAYAKAWKNGLGYFTAALLKCFEGGAGERMAQYGWCITPDKLRRWVEQAGRYGYGFANEDMMPVDDDSAWDTTPILRLKEQPEFPVRLQEAEILDLGRATLRLLHHSTALREERPPCAGKVEALCAWVPPNWEAYEAVGEIAEAGNPGKILLQTLAVPVTENGQDVRLERL